MSLVRLNLAPSHRQLRLFAAASLAVFGWFGLALIRHGHGLPGRGLVVFALAVAALGFWRPRRVRPLYLALTYAAYPIGFLMSYVILAGLFFGVILPIGLGMRLFGYDPLGLRRRPEAKTFWKPKIASRTSGSYFQQS